MKKTTLLLLFAFFSGLFWFYQIENLEVYKFKNYITSEISLNKKDIVLKDFFDFDWDLVCSLHSETVGKSDLYELANYVDSQYKSLVPDTFKMNYNFYLLFIKESKPISILAIKNPNLEVNSKKFYFSADEMVKCYKPSEANIEIINTEKNASILKLGGSK